MRWSEIIEQWSGADGTIKPDKPMTPAQSRSQARKTSKPKPKPAPSPEQTT